VSMVADGRDVDTAGGQSMAPLVVADNENISVTTAVAALPEKGSGWWRQCLFVRNGQRVPVNWHDAQSRWSTAAPIFERILDAANSQGGVNSHAHTTHTTTAF
jgi:hypothetical protein